MSNFKLGIKHMSSSLRDWHGNFSVDEGRQVVTVHMDHFDSVSFASAVTGPLAERGIHAFRDDSLGWNPPRAAYSLQVSIGGVLFAVEVVKLALQGRVTVTLTPLLAPVASASLVDPLMPTQAAADVNEAPARHEVSSRPAEPR